MEPANCVDIKLKQIFAINIILMHAYTNLAISQWCISFYQIKTTGVLETLNNSINRLESALRINIAIKKNGLRKFGDSISVFHRAPIIRLKKWKLCLTGLTQGLKQEIILLVLIGGVYWI